MYLSNVHTNGNNVHAHIYQQHPSASGTGQKCAKYASHLLANNTRVLSPSPLRFGGVSTSCPTSTTPYRSSNKLAPSREIAFSTCLYLLNTLCLVASTPRRSQMRKNQNPVLLEAFATNLGYPVGHCQRILDHTVSVLWRLKCQLKIQESSRPTSRGRRSMFSSWKQS